MESAHFAAGYLRLLYRFLRLTSAEQQRLFASVPFNEADLMRPDFHVPFEQAMSLCRQALKVTPPGLALRVGHQLQVASHGPLGTAMQTAGDLRQALNTFIHFLPIRASFYDMTLQEQGEQTQIKCDVHTIPADLVPFFTEAIVFSLVNCIWFYAGRSDTLLEAGFAYPEPAYADLYRTTFETRIRFAQPTSTILFKSELLQLGSPEADADSFAISVQRCRQHQHSLGQVDNVVAQVQQFLWDNPGKLWSIEEVAQVFAMSSRTLIRKMRDAHTSYQAVRDGVLQVQSVTLLNTMSVEATAISLGFAEASSFRRAFKRWYGANPSQYHRSS